MFNLDDQFNKNRLFNRNMPFKGKQNNSSVNINNEKKLQPYEAEKVVPNLLSLEDKNLNLEIVKNVMQTIRENMEANARETNTLESGIYTKRRNSIDEVEYTLKGIINPYKYLSKLRSKDVFVSYSRRNEEWARKLHLALRAMGMIVWFDNQEMNASSDKKNPSILSNNSLPIQDENKIGIPKGIAPGKNYREAINNAIVENSYTTVLLTHDVLDKFDVIGGQEIPESIDKGCELLVVVVDDPERGSVLERLKQFKKDCDNDIFKNSIEILESSTKVNITKNDFQASPEELGSKILNEITGENEAHYVTKNGNSLSKINNETLREKINDLKNHTPGENTDEIQKYIRSLNESDIIFTGLTNPKKLTEEKKVVKKFSVKKPNSEYSSVEYSKLANVLEKLGLTEDSEEPGWILQPINIEDIRIEREDFFKKFGYWFKDEPRGAQLWSLIPPKFFSKLSDQLDVEQALRTIKGYANSELNFKIRFLENLRKSQGIQIELKDLKDIQGVAEYLLTKQALLTYQENLEKYGFIN